jgi:outer membrane protein assembly factor BamA
LKQTNRKYQRTRFARYCILPALVLLSYSCSNTKYLPKNEALLVSSDVKLKGDIAGAEKDNIRNSLNSPSIMLQHPNTKLLNILRLKLWFYNQKHNEKKVGKIWNWLLIPKNMEPPVIYDSTKTIQTANNMTSYLDNQGYFHAFVNYKQSIKSQKAGVTYQVYTGKNFIIDSISYDIGDSAIRKAVIHAATYSFLKKNEPFTMSKLSQEQARLTDVVRNSGYYKFSNDHVQFVLDTINKAIFNNILDPFANIQNSITVSEGSERPKLNITVQILDPTDSTNYQHYWIRNIYVYPDYSAYSTPDDTTFQQSEYKDLTIRRRRDIIRPRVLYNNIVFKKDQEYSQANYDYTIQKLNQLGVWNFVTVEMDTVSHHADSLDAYIFLTPARKQSLGLNLEATSSSDYIVGGALNLTYKNRNTNRAANQVTASIKSGLEWNSDSSNIFFVQAREFSGQVNVSFPRFITPWHLNHIGRFSNPNTSLGLGVNTLDRFGFFSLTSFNGSFGYNWNETQYKRWIVNPLSISFNRLYNVSDSFAKQLEENPFLKNSFSSTFIGGENVSFIYNSQNSLNQKSFNYLQINLEESGLWLNGIDGIIRGVTSDKSSFAKLTSVNFSQYLKMDVEYKHYLNRPHSTLVSRAYAGIGVPYATSDVLPYIKQFTAGGPNSMRAWRLRALGPGSYYNPGLGNPNIFPDQTGDMKLEGNLEYRFDIFSVFGGFLKVKGATFIDAGNIWDLKNDPYKPGSQFKINEFYQDLAIGGGFGIRLDFSYAILRLDLATPFKEPYAYLPDYGWILNTIHPFSREWRKNNLILNFAVGYPF